MRPLGDGFTVIGVGAIGGIVAAGLVQQGANVIAIDRSAAHVEAVRHHGLILFGGGVEQTTWVDARTPSEMPDRLEQVLLAVRCQDTASALGLIAPRLSPLGYVVSLQNGLNPIPIGNALGSRRTIGAFVNFQAAFTQPGRIHVGRQGSLYIGELDGRTTDRIRHLEAVLGRIRPTTIAGNIMGLLWSKMAYGSILTATALTDADVRDILPRYPVLFVDLAAEALRLAQLDGVTLEPFDVWNPEEILSPSEHVRKRAFQRILDSWQDREIQRTGPWRDLAVHHRRPDIDEKIGLMLRSAEGRLEMPLHRALFRLMDELAAGTRPMSWQNLEELAQVRPVPMTPHGGW